MVYKQKLTKIGNSFGVILPKDLRNLLNISIGTEVHLQPSEDGQSVILSVGSTKMKADPMFFELVKAVDREYTDVLKQLASE